MRLRVFVCLLVLAGCATPTPAPLLPSPPPIVYAPVRGLERLLGKAEAAATALLGKPSLDRRDGPAHHLQFARAACILDVYYYPDAGGQPVARHAAARLPDGKPIEAGDCLQRQTPG